MGRHSTWCRILKSNSIRSWNFWHLWKPLLWLLGALPHDFLGKHLAVDVSSARTWMSLFNNVHSFFLLSKEGLVPLGRVPNLIPRERFKTSTKKTAKEVDFEPAYAKQRAERCFVPHFAKQRELYGSSFSNACRSTSFLVCWPDIPIMS